MRSWRRSAFRASSRRGRSWYCGRRWLQGFEQGGCDQCGLHAMAGDVGEEDQQAPVGHATDVVEVAGDQVQGLVGDADVVALDLGNALEQVALDRTGAIEVDVAVVAAVGQFDFDAEGLDGGGRSRAVRVPGGRAPAPTAARARPPIRGRRYRSGRHPGPQTARRGRRLTVVPLELFPFDEGLRRSNGFGSDADWPGRHRYALRSRPRPMMASFPGISCTERPGPPMRNQSRSP